MTRLKEKKEKMKKSIFSESVKYIADSKKFIYFVFGLFIFSALVGLIYPYIFRELITEIINEIIGKTEHLNFSDMMFFILYNNIRASLAGMLLGIFFGVFPLFLAIVNGYILGFVLNATIQENGIGDLWKILPHGIFEIPAFLISLGFGLRLGYVLLFKTDELSKNLKMCLKTFVFIVLVLLLIAGLIETSLIFLLKG